MREKSTSLKLSSSVEDKEFRRRIVPIAIIILSVCCRIGFAQTWECKTSSAPWTVRSSHSSVSFNNDIWVLNGYQNTGTMWHDIWSSPDGVSWACEGTSVPYPMSSNMGCVVFDDKIWLLGGRDGC